MRQNLVVFFHETCKIGVKAIGFFMMLYLFLLSIFSTSVRSVRNRAAGSEEPVWDRYIYFFKDDPVKLLTVIVLLIIILLLAGYWMQTAGMRERKFFLTSEAVCIIYFFLAVLFIWNTQFYPKSDPAKMLRIAEEILNHDYHEFEAGEYLHRYPYQSGFIIYCMAAIRIFGSNAFLALQVINALAITCVYYLLGKSTEILWNYSKRQCTLATAIFIVCSIPLQFYVTFIYGNIPGMALSVAAVYLELLYLQKRKRHLVIEASVCIAAATVLKSNCMIFLVAMLIVLLADALLSERKWLAAGACVLMAVCSILLNQIVYMGMEAMTGQKLSKGMPKSAFVMMGLEEGFAAPGTENGASNRVFIENNYDYEAADREAKENIVIYLQEYVRDWRRGLDFFGRKQAAQCNEPGFQCFSINADRETQTEVPEWIQSLISGKISLYLLRILNVLHTIIIFGVFVYICSFQIRERKLSELLFLIVYIGDFIFQLFWEAKSQYMVIFFFILLPYAVHGYYLLINWLYGFRDREKRMEFWKLQKKKAVAMGIIAALLLPLLIRVSQTKTFACVLAIQSEEAVQQEYYEIIGQIK